MIYINIQDKWEVCIFMQYDALLIDCLRKLNCSEKTIKREIRKTNQYNSGFTFSNLKLRASVVYISPATSESQWFNTLVHELKHVQSHVCKYYDIEEDSEDAAYLIGYLMQQIITSARI